jgi:hypothetical protein
MSGVTLIVTNIELVIVHFVRPKQTLKETAAGGVYSLFGVGINPFLAVFQNIVTKTNQDATPLTATPYPRVSASIGRQLLE